MLFSDICVLATFNGKGSPCVPAEEESCDKMVGPVLENMCFFPLLLIHLF